MDIETYQQKYRKLKREEKRTRLLDLLTVSEKKISFANGRRHFITTHPQLEDETMVCMYWLLLKIGHEAQHLAQKERIESQATERERNNTTEKFLQSDAEDVLLQFTVEEYE